MAGATFTGNTVLRLFIAGTRTQVAFNDNSCAGSGSQINYVVPHNQRLKVHAGCSGLTVGCGGAIALSARLDASPADAIAYGSNPGVYDAYSPDGPEGLDRDGVPLGRKFDHGGGIQSIGKYIVTTSEFVSLPCVRLLDSDCPEHGNRNIPASGQASQVVAYDIGSRSPKPSLLIARKNEGSGWAAIAKLATAHAPLVLRNGYLLMVPDGDRLSLYAIQADPCTGYASLAQIKPSFALGHRTPPRIDPLAPPACPVPSRLRGTAD